MHAERLLQERAACRQQVVGGAAGAADDLAGVPQGLLETADGRAERSGSLFDAGEKHFAAIGQPFDESAQPLELSPQAAGRLLDALRRLVHRLDGFLHRLRRLVDRRRSGFVLLEGALNRLRDRRQGAGDVVGGTLPRDEPPDATVEPVAPAIRRASARLPAKNNSTWLINASSAPVPTPITSGERLWRISARSLVSAEGGWRNKNPITVISSPTSGAMIAIR